MQIITEIVRNVVVVLLCSSLLLLLLPEGSTARFIRLAVGLVLIASIILPLRGVSGLTLPPAVSDSGEVGEAYAEQGMAISAQLGVEAGDQYAAELSRQAKLLAAQTDGVTGVEANVELDAAGNLMGLQLRLTVSPGTDGVAASQRAQALVSGFYLLDASLVECTIGEVNDDGSG